MKIQLNEIKRMQQLAGLLTEDNDGKREWDNAKYYAIINTSNKYTSQPPLYFSASGKDMISKLNMLYKEMTGKNNSPYTIDDINPYSKMNDFAGMSRMAEYSYIDDGWVSVDDSEFYHKKNLKNYPNAKPLEV
jgi:hypothetical protein